MVIKADYLAVVWWMACDRIAEAFSLVQITLMFIKARSLHLLDDIRCKKENSKLIITFIYMLKKKKKKLVTLRLVWLFFSQVKVPRKCWFFLKIFIKVEENNFRRRKELYNFSQAVGILFHSRNWPDRDSISPEEVERNSQSSSALSTRLPIGTCI